MEMNQSTENITVIPADLYEELLTDETPDEPNAALQAAAARAREVAAHS